MSDGAPKAATALHDLSAVELLAGYAAKTFSPSEVMDDVLGHVARWEPHIQALYAFDPDTGRLAVTTPVYSTAIDDLSAALARVYAPWVGEHRPALTSIGVARLSLPQALLEVQGCAVVPERR